MKNKILITTGLLLMGISGFAQVYKMELNQPDPLSIELGNDTLICPLHPVSLGKDLIISGGAEDYIYMWLPVDGLDDPGSPNPVATISESATYTLTVRDAHNCEITENISIIVDPCTGIDQDQFSSDLNIYPNPSYGTVTISGLESAQGKTKISIVNQIGVEVLRENVSPGIAQLEYDLNSMNLPRGVYFIRIIRGMEVHVYKVQLI